MSRNIEIDENIQLGHPIFNTFKLIAPYLPELFIDDVAIGISDTEKLLISIHGETFSLGTNIGYKLQRGDGMSEAIRTKKPVRVYIPEETFGTPLITTAIPLIDENGQVIGCWAIGTNMRRFDYLFQIASKLSAAVAQVKATVDDLNNSAELYANAMGEISNNSTNVLNSIKDIEKIAVAVRDVSDSTKILGLNASIEAGRAGEAGKGFNVVAQEIGKLADNSKNHIESIRNTVFNINNLIKELDNSIQKVSSESANQNSVLEELSATMADINESANMLTKVAEESSKVK